VPSATPSAKSASAAGSVGRSAATKAGQRDQQEAADQERTEEPRGVAPREQHGGEDQVEVGAARTLERVADRGARRGARDPRQRLRSGRDRLAVHGDDAVLRPQQPDLGARGRTGEESRPDVAVGQEDEAGERPADHAGQLDDREHECPERSQHDRRDQSTHDPLQAGTSRPRAYSRIGAARWTFA
jgi:hypothetical protein